MGETIKTHRDLDVYQMAFEAAMRIFELTKRFPKEETYSLTDQIRRSSKSVCSNIAEAWRKRRYEAAFVSKLNDAEAEAAETQVWLEFSPFSLSPTLLVSSSARIRPSDVPILIRDSTKFRDLAGWAPLIPFERTLHDLLEYWRERLVEETNVRHET